MQVFKTGFIEGHRWRFATDVNKLIETIVLYGKLLVQTIDNKKIFMIKFLITFMTL